MIIIRQVVHEAFEVALGGKPGPVHLDLPKDVMTAICDGPLLPAPRHKLTPFAPPDAVIERVAELLDSARRPIIYAGQGVLNCHEELRELALALHVPVTTTLHAMGAFDERHPLSLHMLGMHGAAYANFAIQNADLILAIGSRFDDRTTGALAQYAPEALAAEKEGHGGIVHFDIEKSQFGRVLEPTVRVEGDCGPAMESLTRKVRARGGPASRGAEAPGRAAWLARCDGWKKEMPFAFSKPAGADAGKIKTQSVIAALYEHVEKEGVGGKDVFISTGVGNHQMMACQHYRWTMPRSIVSSGSLGTMGFGLPAAIGVQMGNPDAMTFLIDGDGSFNMTLHDLGTMAQHELPVKIVLMNDGKQQMVQVWQKLFFEERVVATDNFNPDFVKLAEAYGIEAFSCDNEADLPAAIARLVNAKGPVLADFRVLPDLCLPMVAPGKALNDMFLPGSMSLETAEQQTGLAPS